MSVSVVNLFNKKNDSNLRVTNNASRIGGMRLVSNSHFKKPSSLRYLRSGALITEPFQSQQCIFFKVLFANLSTNLRTYLYYLIYIGNRFLV